MASAGGRAGAGVCRALAAAVALAVGLSSSGNGGSERAARGEAAPRATLPPAATADSKAAGRLFGGAALPATSGRAQLYEAELTLKIADLSAATKRALRLTRDFDGYVRSVEYGSGSERGSAYLVVRVPVGSVQEALVRYSALGQILDQHVSIRDAQPQLDRRFRLLQAQRDLTAKLQAKLESPSLTAAERARLENRLVAARRQLVVLQKQQAALRRQTSYATVSLDLRSKGEGGRPAARAGPDRPRAPPLGPDRRRRGEGARLRAGRGRAVLRAGLARWRSAV